MVEQSRPAGPIGEQGGAGQGDGAGGQAPVRVAVTDAAGQIAYSLLFKLAGGSMLGQD
jgi:hypothetical protein